MLADGVHFSLGFMKSTPFVNFGSELAFGALGAGGAMGFADPKTGIGSGYVTSLAAPASPATLATSHCATPFTRSSDRRQ